jgi:hypothetical protein
MSDTPVRPTNGLPLPLLVNAVTGASRPALPPASLQHLGRDLRGAAERDLTAKESGHLAADYTVGDPDDLTQAGWCVIFANDAQAEEEMKQLQPLIDKRRFDVCGAEDGDSPPNARFQIFSGKRGVSHGQTAQNWAMYRGVSLTAPVSPGKGVPYYALIVGGPERISFEFQQLLKMQWAVGRLAFDNIENYGRYAQAVVAFEQDDFAPVPRKSVAVWMTRNSGDVNTAILSGAIGDDFFDRDNPLGSDGGCQFELEAYTVDRANKPTKAALVDLLFNKSKGPPALLFTGSHGIEYPFKHPDQRRMQGALLTQEWVYDTAPQIDEAVFSANDVPPDANLRGTMAFLFACYSGGCPADDSYYFNQADGLKIPVAESPLVAGLPQALLSRGMLAVIAHVDMAFQWGFDDVDGTPRTQAIRNPLGFLMQGKRVGFAADSLSLAWSTLSAQLGMEYGSFALNAAAAALGAKNTASSTQLNTADATDLANRTIARDDARNYIVLGDPAVKLKV